MFEVITPKWLKGTLASLGLLGLLIPWNAFAQGATTITYQGNLTSPTGEAVPDGSYAMTLALWDAVVLGNNLWSESHGAVEVTAGAFSVELGKTALFDNLFEINAGVWLELTVTIDASVKTFAPRLPFTASAYSFQAQNANALQGVAASGFASSSEFTVHTSQFTDHAGSGSPHHTPFIASDAVAAMGLKDDTNALNHDKFTDVDVATNVDVTANTAARHARYDDGEAVTAMGTLDDVNPLNHDRYSDANVLEALETAPNVGIGTATPGHALDVEGAVNSSLDYKIGGSTMVSKEGANNTFIGIGSGVANSTAQGGVFVGTLTGNANTEGDFNVFIGRWAGLANTTGRENVYIGDISGLQNTSGSNNVYIGDDQQGVDGESQILRIGYNNSVPPLIFGDFAAPSLTINGSMTIEGELTVTGTISGSNFPTKSAGAALSDERLKRNIEPIDGKDALAKLAQLRGVRYEWAFPEAFDSEAHVGFVAQELERVFPEWVEEIVPPGGVSDAIPDGEKAKAIYFHHDFNAYLVEAIKELKSQNELLRSRIDTLENRLDSESLARASAAETDD